MRQSTTIPQRSPSTHTTQPTNTTNNITTIDEAALNITQSRYQPRRQENTPWGDIMHEKPHNVTRVYSQNVNGIKLDEDGGRFKEICMIHQEVQADILCIQEHNLDTTEYKVTKIVRETAHRHWQRVRTTIASTPIQFSGTWKPGGTAIMSTGSITGRTTATGHDEWGRWSYHTFQGKNRLLVTVITVYQVVAKFAPDKGQFTAAAQQRSLLIRQGDEITDPRQAFQRDIRQFIDKLPRTATVTSKPGTWLFRVI
jgi:hypothetical protein